jgi:hypothetical protein
MKKKSATKSVSAPAPAPKATTTPVKKPTALAKKPAATKKPAAPRKIAVASAPALPPAIKPGRPAPVVTKITARIDIGFGNTLHLRGEGPGLSWDKGVPLECVADDEWTITLPESARPVVFKFLVNDLTWSAGPDYVATPGSALVLVPEFEK